MPNASRTHSSGHSGTEANLLLKRLLAKRAKHAHGTAELSDRPFPRAIAHVSSAALLNNYRALRDLSPGQSILPMLKADAYGHGAEWAAQTLCNLPGLYGFGLATFEEGCKVRDALGAKGRKTKVIVFSGAGPWSDEKGEFCEAYGLTPVLATESDWRAFHKGGWAERISYELKFNTGMNRLGIPVAFAPAIARTLRNLPTDLHPSGVLSHLADAEHPESRLSRSQLEKFRAVRGELEGALPSTHFHLANSAAIWNQKLCGLRGMTDVVRPGISLYGVTPWDGAPERGIQAVMSLQAEVVAVNRLKRGESTGYGGTYTVSGADFVHLAVLGAGYADGVFRSISNQGYAWLSGHATQFRGIISMDLCTVACGPKTRPGDWAEIIGPHVDIWAQARAAQTIPYELLTSVSPRVQRRYE